MQRSEQLELFLRGATEQAFGAQLGVTDQAMVGYLSDMLVRFVRCDAIFAVRDLRGRRLVAVVDMLSEAEARIGEAKRQVHRHIGDFTLFWAGIYPEAALKMSKGQDVFLDYREEGKRSYYIASRIPAPPGADADNGLLGRLSHEFDLCVAGLNEVRRELAIVPR